MMEETQRIRREFSERLNALLDEATYFDPNLKMERPFPKKGAGRQVALAAMFGKSQTAARRWLEDGGLPSPAVADAMCKRWNVNVAWLMFGVGPMRIGAANEELLQKIQEAIEHARVPRPYRARLTARLIKVLTRA
jgi:hypothetical protein